MVSIKERVLMTMKVLRKKARAQQLRRMTVLPNALAAQYARKKINASWYARLRV